VSITHKEAHPTSKPLLFFLNQRSFGKLFRILIWLLIPFILWWSLRGVSFAEVSNNLRLMGLRAILILITLNLLIFALITLRWRLILSAQGYKFSFLSLISYRLAGFGVTYFTPGPQFGGEPLQVYLLNQREDMDTSTAAASVAVDKLLELLANFSFLLVGLVVLMSGGFLVGNIKAGLIVIPSILLLLPAAYLIMLRKGKLPISLIIHKIEHRFPNHPSINRAHITLKKTESQVAEFCQENTLGLLVAAALSIGIWIFMVLEFSLMLRFLGANISLAQVLIALTAARIAFLLPLPAGLGTLEAGQVMAMGLIGVSPVVGISLTLLIRVRDILFGGLGLWLGGIYSK
jgi:uncharacterized protein (TIRG00374 family)